MDDVIFIFDSFTYANKAKKLFLRSNFDTKLKKRSGDSGCEYAIGIESKNYYAAIKILRENNIAYKVIRS